MKLKPCPFCPSSPKLVPVVIHMDSFYIICARCGGSGGLRKSERGARMAWNRRRPVTKTGKKL